MDQGWERGGDKGEDNMGGQLDDSWVVSECVKELTCVFLAYEQELD